MAKQRMFCALGPAAFALLAATVVALPSGELAASDRESYQSTADAPTVSDVFEVGFADSLPSTVPTDPRRSLSFPFYVEHAGDLLGLHLHLVADVNRVDAVSVVVLGPDGTTWALDNEAFATDSTGRVDSWLDLLEPGTEFERDARNMPVKGTWTVQVFHLRPGHESTLADLELVIGVGARGVSGSKTGDGSPTGNVDGSAGELETKAFALGTAAAPADGCGSEPSGGGEKSGGCGISPGGTDLVSKLILLAFVLGLIAFLSLRGSRRHQSSIGEGGEG